MGDQHPEVVEVGVDPVRTSKLPDAPVELARSVVRIFLKNRKKKKNERMKEVMRYRERDRKKERKK